MARRGQARVVDEPSGAHFFWLGEWQHFSPAGTLNSVQHYELGKHLSTRYLITKRKLPDY